VTKDEMSAINEETGDLWSRGADIEALLRFLRGRGLSQARSVDALESLTGIDRGEAQIAVLEIDTWSDQYQRNRLIQEELAEALLLLSKEESPKVGVRLRANIEPSDAQKAILRRRRSEKP